MSWPDAKSRTVAHLLPTRLFSDERNNKTHSVGFTTLLAPLAALPLLAAPSPADVEFLNTLDRATAQYFLDQADPQNFLMPVTWSEATGPARRASASGTGLELAALCIADNHGWIGR